MCLENGAMIIPTFSWGSTLEIIFIHIYADLIEVYRVLFHIAYIIHVDHVEKFTWALLLPFGIYPEQIAVLCLHKGTVENQHTSIKNQFSVKPIQRSDGKKLYMTCTCKWYLPDGEGPEEMSCGEGIAKIF